MVELKRPASARAQWGRLGPEPQVMVMSSPSDWEKVSGDEGGPDFVREVAVVVYGGEKPTGGHWVRIGSVTICGQEVIIDYQQGAPGPEDMVTMAFTYPADCAIIKREELPKGNLRFSFRSSTKIQDIDVDI